LALFQLILTGFGSVFRKMQYLNIRFINGSPLLLLMSYAGQEAQVAKALHIVGFPSRVREKLGDSYEAVLNAYIDQTDRQHSGLSNAVFAAESSGDNQLISDLGERVLSEDPRTAYRAGKKSGDDDLRARAEVGLLKGSLREAYGAAVDHEGYDDDFLDRLFEKAVTDEPDEAVTVARWHKEKDGGVRLYGLAEKLLPTNHRTAYHISKEAGNEKVVTAARKAWVSEDHFNAFEYGTNGASDIELAKLAVEHSTDGIKGYNLFRFVSRHMPDRTDLLDEARQSFASEDPSSAYFWGTDERDGRADEQLASLALANEGLPIRSLINAARDTGRDELWDRAGTVLSEQSGLPSDSVKELFR
jgi:hypothetical protein